VFVFVLTCLIDGLAACACSLCVLAHYYRTAMVDGLGLVVCEQQLLMKAAASSLNLFLTQTELQIDNDGCVAVAPSLHWLYQRTY
jgi:hypothetical protein